MVRSRITKRLTQIIPLAILLTISANADAAPIFSQMDGTVFSNAWVADTNNWQPADDFSVGVNTTLHSITWAGDGAGAGSTARIQVFNDGAGTPGSLLYTFDGTSLLSGSHLGYGLLTVGGMNFGLTAGTTYWVSVQGVADDLSFVATTDGSGGNNLKHRYQTGTWNPRGNNGQFLLEGISNPPSSSTSPVPEPTSMALFGLTALGMGVIRKRRKQSTVEEV